MADKISEDEFKQLVVDYMTAMLGATGMKSGHVAPKGSPDGVARFTAATALTMYFEWLVNSAPGTQAEKDKLLSEARRIAREIATDFAKRSRKGVKKGAN